MGRAVDSQKEIKTPENVELHADIRFTQLSQSTKNKLIDTFKKTYYKDPDLPFYLLWKVQRSKPIEGQKAAGFRPAAIATKRPDKKSGKTVYKISFMKEGLD